MKLSQICELLGITYAAGLARLRRGKLPQPIPGTSPRRWSIDDVRAAYIEGRLKRSNCGRKRKVVA
jgi:hypothetical protein